MTPASLFGRAALALVAALFCGFTSAQTYPSKPVRIVVPFPPGGMNDVVARIIARELSEAMGQQFIVDNRGGASGVIGGGEGGNLHVLMALFASMANIRVLHVPYKGGAQMSTSLMSGETQSGIPTIGAVMPHLRSNRLRPLGVASATRSAMLPNVPPIAQSGVPGYDMNPWIGGFAPAKTPKAVTDRLHAETQRILRKPEIAKALVEQGLEPWLASQEEFVKRLRSDYEKYQKVFKIIGTPAAS